MRAPVEKKIEETNYTFTVLDPWESTDLLVDLFKLIGAPAAMAFDQGFAQKEITKLLSESISVGSIVGKLCENVNKETIRDMIKRILSGTLIDGKQADVVFSAHFAGRIDLMFKIVHEALSVEYSSFFGESSVLRSLINRAGLAMNTASQT